MALSAKDVHDKQFKLVRQSTGYDIDEVDAFLDEVEAEIDRLHAELAEARAQAASGSPGAGLAGEGRADEAADAAEDVARPEPGAPDESTDQPQPAGTGSAARLLELAQRTADEYLAEARRTADTLVEEAEEKARAAVAALEAQRADLESRVSVLRTFESEVRTRLTTYFESQLRDLHAIERPEP